MKARIDAQRIQILAATCERILRQHLAIGKIPAVYRPAVDCGLREVEELSQGYPSRKRAVPRRCYAATNESVN